MEFRLIYEGELPTSGNSSRHVHMKHQIRRSFHPQLRRLWLTNPSLRELAERIGKDAYAGEMYSLGAENPGELSDEKAIQKSFMYMSRKWNQSGYECVPLVTNSMALRCTLEILLLRPEEDRYIFKQGDIDGQVKTLFDSLRTPASPQEAGGCEPQEDERPFFCLLEDDRLISDVRVTTDQLLLLPSHREVKANDSFVVVHVKLNHKSPRVYDDYFG